MNIELVSSSRPTSELIAEKKLAPSSVSNDIRSKSPPPRASSSLYTSQKQSSSTMSYANSGSKTFSNISSITTPSTAKDTLSNRFKSVGSNSDVSINLPDSKKSEFNKINVDTSIIHQVLFNKKQNANARPVTFTVKL